MNELVQLVKSVFFWFQQYGAATIALLALLGISLDMTPWIKFNPIKFVFKRIGKSYSNYLNDVFKDSTKELKEKIDKQGECIDDLKKNIVTLRTDMEQIKSDNIDKEINDMRWEILDFENAQGYRDYGEEMYHHVMDVHDRYEKIIEENNIKNGRMDVAYANILAKYREKFCK